MLRFPIKIVFTKTRFVFDSKLPFPTTKKFKNNFLGNLVMSKIFKNLSQKYQTLCISNKSHFKNVRISSLQSCEYQINNIKPGDVKGSFPTSETILTIYFVFKGFYCTVSYMFYALYYNFEISELHYDQIQGRV